MLDLRRLADHIFENVTTTYYSIAPLTSLAGSAPGSYPYRRQDCRRGCQWRQKLIERLSFLVHRGILVSYRSPFPHIGSLLFRSRFFRRTIRRVVM